jgi:hypothetical protein
MEIMYQLEKQNVRANALSRREQNIPVDAEDERLRKRLVQVLKPTTSYYRESSKKEKEPETT